jgi:uncharacterized membrane protein YhiD involved in acid resistance
VQWNRCDTVTSPKQPVFHPKPLQPSTGVPAIDIHMPEWLTQSVSLASSLSIGQLTVRLLLAGLFGGCVAAVYRWSHGRDHRDCSTLFATLVLLSVLIAMVSLVIGDSVARAFSLVGALSIVRFRTVVEDTRDTAFVIFAVVVGMAAGAGLVLVPLIGIPVVGAIAIGLSRWSIGGNETDDSAESVLNLRVAIGHNLEAAVIPVINQRTKSCRLTRAETARQGTVLDLKYELQLDTNANMATLVTELNGIEGVEQVELRA